MYKYVVYFKFGTWSMDDPKAMEEIFTIKSDKMMTEKEIIQAGLSKKGKYPRTYAAKVAPVYETRELEREEKKIKKPHTKLFIHMPDALFEYEDEDAEIVFREIERAGAHGAFIAGPVEISSGFKVMFVLNNINAVEVI